MPAPDDTSAPVDDLQAAPVSPDSGEQASAASRSPGTVEHAARAELPEIAAIRQLLGPQTDQFLLLLLLKGFKVIPCSPEDTAKVKTLLAQERGARSVLATNPKKHRIIRPN